VLILRVLRASEAKRMFLRTFWTHSAERSSIPGVETEVELILTLRQRRLLESCDLKKTVP
jgi:hypothetical protein